MKPRRLGVAGLVGAALSLLTTGVAHAGNKCVEVSDTVGRKKCSEFGSGWAIEKQLPITFRFGFRYNEFSTGDRTFREAFRSRSRPKNYVGYRIPGSALGVPRLQTGGVDGGVAFFIVDQLYIGLEGGITFGAMDSRTISLPSKQLVLVNDTGADVNMAHYGAPLGYRIPLGRASIRAEMFFGGVDVTISHRAVNERGETLYRAETGGRALIEPRVAADIWFTQHISFGAYAGLNLLDTRGRALGLSLTWHHRAFDGDMSLW